MHKRIIRLVLLAALALAAAGFTAAPAGAANCNDISTGSIYYSGGQWVFSETVSSCSGVNAVAFYGVDNGDGTGIYDVTRNAWHYTTTYSVTAFGQYFSYTNNGPHTNVWGQGCGFPSFQVKPFYYYKLRNVVGNTWGSWHSYMAPTPQSIC